MSIGRSTGAGRHSLQLDVHRGSGTKGDLSTSTHGAQRTGWRTKAVVYITARGLGSVIDGLISPGTGFQQEYGDGPLKLNDADTTLIKRFYSINR